MIAPLCRKSNSIIFLQQKSCVRSIFALWACFSLKPYFFVYCGAKLRPDTQQKWLDFLPWSSYYTTTIRDRNRPAAWRSWAIVLYHIYTTDRFGTHGNSGHKSDEKCHILCEMHWKALESAIKNIIRDFGSRMPQVRILSLGPCGVSV